MLSRIASHRIANCRSRVGEGTESDTVLMLMQGKQHSSQGNLHPEKVSVGICALSKKVGESPVITLFNLETRSLALAFGYRGLGRG
jgi:hypothetical protein